MKFEAEPGRAWMRGSPGPIVAKKPFFINRVAPRSLPIPGRRFPCAAKALAGSFPSCSSIRPVCLAALWRPTLARASRSSLASSRSRRAIYSGVHSRRAALNFLRPFVVAVRALTRVDTAYCQTLSPRRGDCAPHTRAANSTDRGHRRRQKAGCDRPAPHELIRSAYHPPR